MLLEAPDAAYEVSAVRFVELACLRLGGRLRALGERSGAYLSDAILQRDRYVEATVRLLSNMQWLARDDLAGDAENFERGRWSEDLPHYHLPHGYAIQVLGERNLYAGTVADSAEDLERRIAVYRRSLIGRVVFVNRLEIDWVTARLSLALAAREIDASRHRARAAAMARRHAGSGFDYHLMWSLLTRAAIAHQTGAAERCAALLREAAETDRGAETPHLRAAARRRLRTRDLLRPW